MILVYLILVPVYLIDMEGSLNWNIQLFQEYLILASIELVMVPILVNLVILALVMYYCDYTFPSYQTGFRLLIMFGITDTSGDRVGIHNEDSTHGVSFPIGSMDTGSLVVAVGSRLIG